MGGSRTTLSFSIRFYQKHYWTTSCIYIKAQRYILFRHYRLHRDGVQIAEKVLYFLLSRNSILSSSKEQQDAGKAK